MESRLTLSTTDSFLELLTSLQKAGEKAYLLFDDNGMTRAEDFIKEIITDVAKTIVELESGLKIELSKIIALNGIFLPEYAEC